MHYDFSRVRRDYEGEPMCGRPILLAVLLMAVCMDAAWAQDSTPKKAVASGIVTGAVTYLERIALPSDAAIQIVLQDVSRTDVPATTISTVEFASAGKQVPIPFELKYDPAQIDGSHRYSVRATISTGGKLMFASATGYPVLTQGAPSTVEIVMQMAQSASSAEGSSKTVPLEETHWQLIELNGETIGEDEQEAYIVLHEDGDKLTGSAGCNRLFGSFDLSGSSLSFHSVASTLMACSGMDHESQFLQALKMTDSYRIAGEKLELRDGDRLLAKFQAKP